MFKILATSTLAMLPFAFSPALAQAPDMSRHPICASFGKAAANWENRAKGQGCTLAFPGQTTFNGNEGAAYTWCMKTSDASFRGRNPQALGHKSNLERLCGAQLRRPVKL